VQLAHLPTRNEIWRAAMLGMIGGAVAAVTLIEAFARAALGHAYLLKPHGGRLRLRDGVHLDARVTEPRNRIAFCGAVLLRFAPLAMSAPSDKSR
jgi:hypothetical protein